MEYSLSELSEILQSWMVRADVLGATPSGPSRGDEIQQWLDRFGGPAAIDSFVILDDFSDMGKLASHRINTEFETGLTMEYARQAVEFLRVTRV